MKNVFKLNYYYATGDLVKALEKFIQQYNNEQNPRSLNNLPPAEVYFVRGKVIKKESTRLKNISLHELRMEYK